MDKKKLMLLMGALVVAIGTALAAKSILTGHPAPDAQAAAQVPQGPKVLVAQRALPVGTIITADAVTFQPWPKDLVQDAYFEEGKQDMSKLLGTVVRNPITAGQPLTQGSLVRPGDRGFLAAALGPGMRAVTIPVSARTGVAGFVFPGDHIDLVLTQSAKGGGEEALKVSETILRNLRILATDQSPEQIMIDGKTQVRLASTVTLEVTPRIAEKIAVAETLGTISLSLRSLADNSADLEHILAGTSVNLPKGANPAQEDAALKLAAKSPGGDAMGTTGNTYTTGGDVSKFQLRGGPTFGRSSRPAAVGAVPSVMPAVPAAGVVAPGYSRRPRHYAEPPVIHITRGKSTETLTVGG